MIIDRRIILAITMRNSIHNLVIKEKNILDNKIFYDKTKNFIKMLESNSYEAYLDGIPDPDNKNKFISAKKFYSYSQATQKALKAKHTKNFITTVGIGANIENQDVRDHFDKILIAKSIGSKGLMDKVYKGKVNLNDQQIDIIFYDCLTTRLSELELIYSKKTWYKLRVNEQITIISLYFNLPSLVDNKTNFYKHIASYVENNDKTHLQCAVNEIIHKSNRTKSHGLQIRREAEGAMLASYNVATYTKPRQLPDDFKILTAIINKTTMPLHNKQDTLVQGKNSKYFIWRTQLDAEVRQDHLMLDGKIFYRDLPPLNYMPGSKYDCRCYAENVPEDILVEDSICKYKISG